LEDQQRDDDPDPLGHGGNRVQSDQERGISQCRGARHQLHDSHRRDEEEHAKWHPPPKEKRGGERGIEPDVGMNRASLEKPTGAKEKEAHGDGDIDPSGVPRIPVRQRFPNPPGSVHLPGAVAVRWTGWVGPIVVAGDPAL
jgi:hypothetical protein